MTNDGAVYSARFSIDGKRVVTASADRTAGVWREFWSLIDGSEALMPVLPT